MPIVIPTTGVYATRTDFEREIEGWTTDDPDALDRLLMRAEADIDAFVGPVSVESNGRKFGAPNGANEKGLFEAQRVALMRATVAQAYWRYRAGEEFFYDSSFESVNGPDFATTGKRSRISPQARAELAGTGLVIRSARVA